MFKIGDKIQIVRPSDIFSMWFDMAKIMELKNWISGTYPRKGQIGIVTHIIDECGYVYGIEIEGRSYIISERGIKLYKPRKLW